MFLILQRQKNKENKWIKNFEKQSSLIKVEYFGTEHHIIDHFMAMHELFTL